MNELLSIMLPPFVACLILAVVHAYLGLHVLQRGVIFVDLALAQLAALGATVGFLAGHGLHSSGAYYYSLTFALCGAALFALLRSQHRRVPPEALIGITYAVAAAAAILILSRAPEGGEELKGLLVGHLLFVEWAEITKLGAIYALIGALHWLLRRPLLQISADSETAARQGLPVRLYDFFFYATFAFVVTSSVELAGVLLVFSFLVAPAVCAALLADTIKTRLWIGWGVGSGSSLVGMLVSYWADLPTGATVVCVLGAVVVVVVYIWAGLRGRS